MLITWLLENEPAQFHMSHILRKPFMPYVNNKGADQPAHPRSLISTFVIRCLDSIISLVSLFAISWLTCLCSWAGWFESYLVENPDDRFFRDEAHVTFYTTQCTMENFLLPNFYIQSDCKYSGSIIHAHCFFFKRNRHIGWKLCTQIYIIRNGLGSNLW